MPLFLHLGRLARHDLLGPARGVAPVRGHLVLVVLLELRVVVLVGDDVQERELDEQAHGLAEVRRDDADLELLRERVRVHVLAERRRVRVPLARRVPVVHALSKKKNRTAEKQRSTTRR